MPSHPIASATWPPRLARQLESRQVLLLENLRFHAGEEANDQHFSRQLASLCNVYVNDAFGSAHRAHASTEGITHFVTHSAAGLLMEKELNYLGKALEAPEKPFVAILGGAKVSDKIEVIHNLLSKVDALLIGGGMAYTFLKAKGQDVGKSLVEADKLDVAREALKEAEAKGVTLSAAGRSRAGGQVCRRRKNPNSFEGRRTVPCRLDGTGHRSQHRTELFTTEIARARTIHLERSHGRF